jgi:peptidoglycan hydrolase-like protein with peptidoglycan-binding domain
LLSHIEDPDVAIDTAMSRVRADVWNETKNKQLPWVNTSIIGEFDLNPTARPPVRTDVAAASPPAPDREAREDLLWESAQHSDLASDYRVYLEAYPSGVFAQMARNRIAALEPGAPAPVSRTSPPPGSGIPSLKDEAADEAAERALGLDPAARKEIQLRLTLLGFPAGVADGEFAEATRAAIREWQRSHGLDPSGWLGPLQYAELKSESESEYHHQRFVRTQAAPPPAPAIDAEPPAASPPQAALPPVSPPPAPAIEAQPPLAPLPTAPAVKAKPPTPPRRASLPPAPAIPAKPPEAPRVRKPIAETKRHPTDAAPVEPAPRAPTPPPPASAEIGPCVPGFHTVSSPTHLGYRCVQDGY